MFEIIHPPRCANVPSNEDIRSIDDSIAGESLRSFRPNQFGMIKIAGNDGYFYANTKGKNKMLELILNQEQYNKQNNHFNQDEHQQVERISESRQLDVKFHATDNEEREKAPAEPESKINGVTKSDISAKGTAHELNERKDLEKDNASSEESQGVCKGLSSDLSKTHSAVLPELLINPSDASAISIRCKRLHRAQLSPGTEKVEGLTLNHSDETCLSPMSILSTSKQKAYNMVRRLSSFRKVGQVKQSTSSNSSVLGANYSDAAMTMLQNKEKSCLSPTSVASTRKLLSMKKNKTTKPTPCAEPACSNEKPLILTRHLSHMNNKDQKNFSRNARSFGAAICPTSSTVNRSDIGQPANTDNSTPRLATFLKRNRSANPSVSSRWSASNTTPLISNARKVEGNDSAAHKPADGNGGDSHNTEICAIEVTGGSPVAETENNSGTSSIKDIGWNASYFGTATDLSLINAKAKMDGQLIPTNVSWVDFDKQTHQSIETGEAMAVMDVYSMRSGRSRGSVLSFFRGKKASSFRSPKSTRSFKGQSIANTSSSVVAAESSARPNKIGACSESERQDAPNIHIKPVVNLTENLKDQDRIPFEVSVLEQVEEASILSGLQLSFLSPQASQAENTPKSVPQTPGFTIISETSQDKRTWIDLKNELEKKLEHHAESSSPYQTQACRSCGFDLSFGKCFSF